MLCYYPLGESRVSAYRLTPVGFSQYWSGSPESDLGNGLSIHWRGLEYLIWPIFTALTQTLLVCRRVQSGYQTLEAGLGDLVPESILTRPPCVGACLRIN